MRYVLLALLVAGCSTSVDRHLDELERLRDRLCDCPTASCAARVQVELDSWMRNFEAEAKQHRRYDVLIQELWRCQGRFAM